MGIRHLQQPTRFTCGQTCVAMLLGISVEDVVNAVGHARPTRWSELRDAIRRLGGWADERLCIIHTDWEDIPDTAIMRMWWDVDGRTHWVLRTGNVIHDPLAYGPQQADILPLRIRSRRQRLTSYASVHSQPACAFRSARECI